MARRTFAAEDDRAVDFIDLAWSLHRDDPHWIPPLQMRQLDELSADSPFCRHGRLRLFLCEDGGRTVGRIAALVNDKLPGIGQIGYFESVDDHQVAGSLFRQAFAWLGEQGVQQVLGPMNGGLHRGQSLMTGGFDTEPYLLEPRNPPYYPRLFEDHGFVPVRHWHGYDLDRAGIDALAGRLHRLLERGGHDLEGFEVRTCEGADAEALAHRFFELASDAWRGEVGYAAATRAELDEVFGGLLSLLNGRNLGTVVDPHGAVCAVVFMYPDYGREVHGLRGDDAAWGRWNRLPQSRRMVVHTAARLPAAHDADPLLMLLEHAARGLLGEGFQRLVFAPLRDEPRYFRGIAEPDREYALYGRPL